MSKKYDVYFELKEIGKPDKKGKRAVTLVDQNGYMCGLFATYGQAKKAIPKIRRNLIREYKRREKLKTSK